MSYSFNVRAASKALAIIKVDDELAKVVAAQPAHDADRIKAQAVAEAFINLLDEPSAGTEISVSMSGSVGISTARIVAASIAVQAFIVAAA